MNNTRAALKVVVEMPTVTGKSLRAVCPPDFPRLHRGSQALVNYDWHGLVFVAHAPHKYCLALHPEIGATRVRALRLKRASNKADTACAEAKLSLISVCSSWRQPVYIATHWATFNASCYAGHPSGPGVGKFVRDRLFFHKKPQQ
jgi:hypothetical protein